jgi:hypothetical protein
MSDIKLTYDETPLAWPASVDISDLNSCKTCGIRILAPQPGPLQCLSRRQGKGAGGDGKGTGQGAGGDGVNIDEYIGIGADYSGQRYSFEEAIFHTPGLHLFPGQKDLYPAEYHIHMRTMSAPIRYITIVLPVSHMVAESHTKNYFAAISAHPDPSVKRPTLETLFQGENIKVVQYEGPDIRKRTEEQPIPANQNMAERTFLLVMNVACIRATDLERIPREGSASTDPRDLPAPGVKPIKKVLRDRLLRSSILADPGILHEKMQVIEDKKSKVEMECRPVKVVNGRDVIENFDGKIVDVRKLLGMSELAEITENKGGVPVIRVVTFILSVIFGIFFADYFLEKLWTLFFLDSDRLHKMSWIKIMIYVTIILCIAGYYEYVLTSMGLN